ncbi:MAG: MotA/TolQ/ExbB proton channel family protein [Gemmatimonadota bacterium]
MSDSQYALIELFRDGGVMMYPLVLFSLLALGVIIAKGYMLHVAHRDSRKLLDQARLLTQAGKVRDAVRVVEQTPGPVAAILHAGLSRIDETGAGSKGIEKAIATTGAIELGFLERGLVLLATVSNVAPLTGFLGTVVGMIAAFAAIAEAGTVEPQLVAGGIKVALITTATGLTIAIPVNIAYNFFVTRIDKLIVDMEEGVETVLDIVARMAKSGDARLSPSGARSGARGPAGTGDSTPV